VDKLAQGDEDARETGAKALVWPMIECRARVAFYRSEQRPVVPFARHPLSDPLCLALNPRLANLRRFSAVGSIAKGKHAAASG